MIADYDTIDPRARNALRELHDAEYESSTPGTDRWRDRLAQRHRHGRTLDLPPISARRREQISRQAGLAVGVVIVALAWLLLALVS